MTSPVRVRFSPAPTGSLHVGGARTALFNWLFARHHGGAMVLRIEDTDIARSRAEWVSGIEGTLGWLGLDWDEGPVLQSTRFDRYRAAADRLLADGRVYGCYCTEDELKARNELARAAGRSPGYDGHCRHLTASQRSALEAQGRPRMLRFRTPDAGVSRFDDLVRGEVAVEWATVADFVIVRSDGTPLFFLANAVDDAEMSITHVIRGEDLLDSTHRVLALREALGVADRPRYAHLPLIVGADRAKLSKRHGAVALEAFRDRGYLPEALLNYLALLGWAPADGRELLSRDELIAEFDLAHVVPSAASFDYQKLDWMNGEYIRMLTLSDLVARVVPLVHRRYDDGRYGDGMAAVTVEAAVAIGQERAVTLESLVDQMDFLFTAGDGVEIAPESWERLAATDRVDEILDAVIAHLEGCAWTVEAIDLRPVIDALGIKARKAMPALYAAVEGRHAGLPLFDSVLLLGRERALARLRAARVRLG